ncbi:bifunctional 2-C-methyl-D-erythritol 4-phosphate cytidylyltransferase/2-C-methyl-D-erythritol 2,4-cyclodiphosphate synthase [Shinella sp. CPCC 101442]|uniref:bifunctional 2-C-methyl-D-erythritol 4-phosphate cytidylyltransferase/2-C-methyl-D-erythritol 2,4-cyclodiphosphate synthase n=1 Tax=Shinella sp. CPCC 101442 TaxID=2932265 RepID=UPI002152C990|nr:bifunctional 2-C-methyl-D-erythritol 4-phosphate cytidylyltransferase/2-C-methyl-D-erythritol 2,4-cyclodiphosphate synthase [Shinella sp. CPCC 101442]MCR6501935.1 bifunctional 2-C-methyl-D-erythritol 4-phosphate cytidylyltransferase/2-C-methyl-D-erythritol 2,4-cyclodiphosphate synthase [Shinella sp. CPCC 101442]
MTEMQPENTLSCGVVIVAAGRGERAGSHAEGPKQYRRIGGRPVISHTLDLFVNWRPARRIVVVIHPDDAALFETARIASLPAGDRLTVVHGGATRQQSVLAGLEVLANDDISHVLIQDAVRPFVEPAILERILTAFGHGARAVLPAVAVADTLKRADANGNVAETVSRSGLFAAQTPQSFHFATILEAHRRASASGRTDFTDDASIAEWAGVRVHLVEGSAGNVKLTLQKDIAMADQRLSNALPDVRTGNGYDVHQLVDGDGVTLCGLFIPHDQKLSGHSDADVALHALTDALLATCGAGDIGDHFPPSDMRWKGAASRIFLEHAASIVRAKGGTIMNADVSLIAEAPKVGPHRDAMRQNLSDFLGISIDRCSVKATTNEKIGFIGRREGIAAIATATVVYKGTDA